MLYYNYVIDNSRTSFNADPTIFPYCREYHDTCYERRKENENELIKGGYGKEIRRVIYRVKRLRLERIKDNQTKCNEKRDDIVEISVGTVLLQCHSAMHFGSISLLRCFQSPPNPLLMFRVFIGWQTSSSGTGTWHQTIDRMIGRRWNIR